MTEVFHVPAGGYIPANIARAEYENGDTSSVQCLYESEAWAEGDTLFVKPLTLVDPEAPIISITDGPGDHIQGRLVPSNVTFISTKENRAFEHLNAPEPPHG